MNQQHPPAGLLSRIVGGIAAFFSGKNEDRSEPRGEPASAVSEPFGAPILIAKTGERDAHAAGESLSTPVEGEVVETSEVVVEPMEDEQPQPTHDQEAPLLLTPEHALPATPAPKLFCENFAQEAAEPAPGADPVEAEQEPEVDDTAADPAVEEFPAEAVETAGNVDAVAEVQGEGEEAVAPIEPMAAEAAEDSVEEAHVEASAFPETAALAPEAPEPGAPEPETTAREIAEAEAAAEEKSEAGAADIQMLAAAMTVDGRGKMRIPKEFFRSMRSRFGASRTDTTEMLKACHLGYAQRGDGKKILCAWVEAVLSLAPRNELTLSELRANLPAFIITAYGEHAPQGLVGAVSRCDFLAVIRDGERITEGRARASDIIRIA